MFPPNSANVHCSLLFGYILAKWIRYTPIELPMRERPTLAVAPRPDRYGRHDLRGWRVRGNPVADLISVPFSEQLREHRRAPQRFMRSKNSPTVRIVIPRKEPSSRRSRSPVTRYSARPATAASRK